MVRHWVQRAVAAGVLWCGLLPVAAEAQMNDYGGYDVAGGAAAAEAGYGETPGWTVYAGTVDGRFAYCAGETAGGGQIWRLGYDGMQWQLAVPVRSEAGWEGQLVVDGQSQYASGTASGEWTFAWLHLQDLENIRLGTDAVLDVARYSFELPLRGTAAVTSKIEECVARQGVMAAAAARPVATAMADGGACPAGEAQLPLSGLCAGAARAVLAGRTMSYELLLPDPSCSWEPSEVAVVDTLVLYAALQCNGVTAALEFAGGAQYAQLILTRSAIDAGYGGAGEVSDGPALVWIAHTDPMDVLGDLERRSAAAITDPGMTGRCALRATADGYAYDVRAGDPLEFSDGPREPICGNFSVGDGSDRFWRVSGPLAFLFDLPGEAYQEFDPASLTVLLPGPSGGYLPAP